MCRFGGTTTKFEPKYPAFPGSEVLKVRQTDSLALLLDTKHYAPTLDTDTAPTSFSLSSLKVFTRERGKQMQTKRVKMSIYLLCTTYNSKCAKLLYIFSKNALRYELSIVSAFE